MHTREQDDFFVTIGCFGLSGIALALGIWIAAAPLSPAAAPHGHVVTAAPVCDSGGCGAAGVVPVSSASLREGH